MRNDDWWEDLYYNINDLRDKGKGLKESKKSIGVYGLIKSFDEFNVNE